MKIEHNLMAGSNFAIFAYPSRLKDIAISFFTFFRLNFKKFRKKRKNFVLSLDGSIKFERTFLGMWELKSIN